MSAEAYVSPKQLKTAKVEMLQDILQDEFKVILMVLLSDFFPKLVVFFPPSICLLTNLNFT